MKSSEVTKPHHGQNIRRLRDFRGIKQLEFAKAMGEDYDQKKISAMENKEELDEETLAKAAKALGVTPDVIQNLEPDKGNYFNTFNGPINGGSFGHPTYCTLNFNPIDKIADLYDELLKSEREKNLLLERLLENERTKKSN